MSHPVDAVDEPVPAVEEPSAARDTRSRLPRSGAGTPFWPVDPPRYAPRDVPAAYRAIPLGLRVAAALQMLVAVGMLVAYWQMSRARAVPADQVFEVLLAGATFIAGFKLMNARGWAWWLSCALIYFGVLTVIGGVVKAQLLGATGAVGAGVLTGALLCGALAYLNLPAIVRAIRFQGGALSTAGLRVSAATAGFGLALIRLGLQLSLSR